MTGVELGFSGNKDFIPQESIVVLIASTPGAHLLGI